MTGVMMTPSLIREWRDHASPFMTRWLVALENRGRVRTEKDRQVSDLRKAIDDEPDPGIRSAMTKDLHLSEAAIWHGAPVASLDEKQRSFLRRVAATYPLAGRIQWVNPLNDSHEEWRLWLVRGCLESDKFCTES